MTHSLSPLTLAGKSAIPQGGCNAINRQVDGASKEDIDSRLSRSRRRQSRPNVYIEAGYAIGVRPKRTIFIEWPDRKRHFVAPSDFQGIHSVRFDDTPEGRIALKKRLENARCRLSLSKNWKSMVLSK